MIGLLPVYLACIESLAYLNNDMYLPALPALVTDLDLNTQAVGLTLSLWFLGSGALQLCVGPLSDRVGRRPILQMGIGLLVLSTCSAALAPELNTLLVARFFQGMSVCFIVVAVYAIVYEHYDRHHSVRVLSMMGSVTVLAPALGPLVGSILLKWTDWRGLFWFIAVTASLLYLCLNHKVPETLKKKHSLVFSIIFRDYLSILKRPQFVVYLLWFSASFSVIIAWLSAGPLILEDLYPNQPLAFGLCQTLVFACFILGNRQIAKKEQPDLSFFLKKGLNYQCMAFPFMLSGYLVIAYLNLSTSFRLLPCLIGLMLTCFSVGLTLTPARQLAILSGEEPQGLRVALFSTLMGVSASISSAVVLCFPSPLLGFLTVLLLCLGLIMTLNGTYKT